MIYLTIDQISKFYGSRIGGLGAGRFNAHKKSSHSDAAYKYEFGYYDGFCLYAIIQKKSGKQTGLEEAAGLRALNGNGTWKLNTPFDQTKNPEKIQELLDDVQLDLGFFYQRLAEDKKSSNLICVHQKRRHQLVIYHPKWRPDLDQVAADPI